MFAERERGAENFQRLIRTEEWKYVYSSDGRSQLYHLAQDPGETKNLARDPDFEAIQTRLEARLRRWMEDTGDTRVLAKPKFRGQNDSKALILRRKGGL